MIGIPSTSIVHYYSIPENMANRGTSVQGMQQVNPESMRIKVLQNKKRP